MFIRKHLLVVLVLLMVGALFLLSGCADGEEEETGEKPPIVIGLMADSTGLLENYARQTIRGFELGIEYATGGTGMVAGREIKVIIEDTEMKPDVAVQKATKLIEDDKADILVGTTNTAGAIAVLGVAEEYKTVIVVEPAAGDSITGEYWNEYVFRTGRNNSQDSRAMAAVFADEGVRIATFAPDYAFGHDAVNAFVQFSEERGAEIVLSEFVPLDATDFTASILKVMEAQPDYLFISWAGVTAPWTQMLEMGLFEEVGLIALVADTHALRSFGDDALEDGDAVAVYYYELPDNEINDWLVTEHLKRYNEIPELFTAGGMAAAIAIVEALEKTGGDAGSDALIPVMKGMSFNTPKGMMTFRAEDHQALQVMYHVTFEQRDDKDYPVPVLIREVSAEECAPPIRN